MRPTPDHIVFICGSGSTERVEDEGSCQVTISTKKIPSWVQDQNEGVAGGNTRKLSTSDLHFRLIFYPFNILVLVTPYLILCTVGPGVGTRTCADRVLGWLTAWLAVGGGGAGGGGGGVAQAAGSIGVPAAAAAAAAGNAGPRGNGSSGATSAIAAAAAAAMGCCGLGGGGSGAR